MGEGLMRGRCEAPNNLPFKGRVGLEARRYRPSPQLPSRPAKRHQMRRGKVEGWSASLSVPALPTTCAANPCERKSRYRTGDRLVAGDRSGQRDSDEIDGVLLPYLRVRSQVLV